MARPAASTPDTAKYKAFMTNALTTDPLRADDIPGIGKASVPKLAAIADKGKGLFAVNSSAKVMGLFALFNRNEVEFIKFLSEECEVSEYLARRVAEALNDKTQDFCDDSPYPKGVSGTNADGSSKVAQNFENNRLSTQRLNDKGGVVPGLKLKVTTVEDRVRRMLRALGGTGSGTLSTLQLAGLYMLMGEAEFRNYFADIITEDNLGRTIAVLKAKTDGLCSERVPKSGNKMAKQTTTTTTTTEVVSPGPPVGLMVVGFVALIAFLYLKVFS